MSIDRRSLFGLTAGAVMAGAGNLTTSGVASAKAPLATKQNAGFYHYKIGDLQITAINDGFFDRPLDGFIKNAEPAALQQALAEAAMPSDKLRIPFTTSVINTGSKLVLIDTGNGNSGAPTSGAWMDNFKAAGYSPEQVDLIIFSHFHGDHINGLRLKDGSSPFPNAELMVPAAEWAFWMDDGQASRAPEAQKGNFANVRRVFDPVKAKVIQYEADKELVPGIRSIATYGHTPGHTTLSVTSGNDKLLLLADTSNHPALFVRKPEWAIIFDIDAAAATVSRKKMLDMAIADKMQVAFYHAPFPATGRIVKDGAAGYQLVPTSWSGVL